MHGIKALFALGGCVIGSLIVGCSSAPTKDPKLSVNDIHSQLNSTQVAEVVSPQSVTEVKLAIQRAKVQRLAVSISAGRHAMGGQQFGSGTLLLDMSRLNRILGFDREVGVIEVEAGAQWPEIVAYLIETQKGQAKQWGIRQKQTGADRLSIGGALSANVHGRGLTFKPFISDVESFTIVDANGELKTCSRVENGELFRLAIGGYGLFGVITTVKFRLVPRQKLERIVEIGDIANAERLFQDRIKRGFLYGDFQYAIDPKSKEFLSRGVFSTYRPVAHETSIGDDQKELAAADWGKLYYLAHADKSEAFKRYSSYYLSTSGQIYWSDLNQMSVYLDDYHRVLDQKLGDKNGGTEMITEVYVPRKDLSRFFDGVREDFRKNRTDVIYGTVRLIERDQESFLAWAKKPYACVIFNLHVSHTDEGIERAKKEFRGLIDRALQFGGSYFLTYHRWATKEQVERAYPQFVEFLKLKRTYDPEERFQSDWYRHYRQMFHDKL